jgi:molybdopterin synthase sulfur carrier subunit
MKLTLKYFASVREILGVSQELFQTDATTVATLRAQLLLRGEGFAQAFGSGHAVRAAVNQVMATDQTALTEGCEVAFFPPVTGG